MAPLGFWVDYFIVRAQLKPAGKWGKDTVALIIVLVLTTIAVIGFFAGMVLVSMGGARQEARDAKRQADLAELANAQNLYYTDHQNTYFTCSQTGGDCGGKTNNYPVSLYRLNPTPTDPLNNGQVCNTSYTYCGLDNTINSGADF